MDEEKKIIENGEKVEPNTSDYLDAIKGLKQKEDDLSKENKQLREDNKKLLNDFLNGGVKEDEPSQAKRTNEEVLKEMNTKQLTNLDFWKDALEVRENCLKEGKPDPFLNYGFKTQPTETDIEAANRVARVVQECIDYADGDSDLFTSKLQSEIRG